MNRCTKVLHTNDSLKRLKKYITIKSPFSFGYSSVCLQ